MSAPRAIGGVFPSEAEGPSRPDSIWQAWTRGWKHAASYSNARSALAALLAQRQVRRLWLPAYVCTAVADAAAGLDVAWYAVSPTLEPDTDRLARDLAQGDAVLVVDYFGRAPGPAFAALATARRDVLWIEDRAQALAPDATPWGDVILYSPRKLLGVADGGVLLSNTVLPQPGEPDDDPNLWAPEDARAADPAGDAPEGWYPLFQQREVSFAVGHQPISTRTYAALNAVAAAPIVAARKANWRVLAQRLGDLALWPILEPSFSPLAFPVLVEDAAHASKALAERRLWCPRHWADLPAGAGGDPVATDLSCRMLSLPCDQRYGAADMARLADAVRGLV